MALLLLILAIILGSSSACTPKEVATAEKSTEKVLEALKEFEKLPCLTAAQRRATNEIIDRLDKWRLLVCSGRAGGNTGGLCALLTRITGEAEQIVVILLEKAPCE